MRLTYKQLKKYTVETQSGIKVGHVTDLVLDTEGQHVAQYIVKIHMIGGQTLLVSRDQVVRFSKDILVVDDTVMKEATEELNIPPIGTPEAIAMRETE